MLNVNHICAHGFVVVHTFSILSRRDPNAMSCLCALATTTAPSLVSISCLRPDLDPRQQEGFSCRISLLRGMCWRCCHSKSKTNAYEVVNSLHETVHNIFVMLPKKSNVNTIEQKHKTLEPDNCPLHLHPEPVFRRHDVITCQLIEPHRLLPVFHDAFALG